MCLYCCLRSEKQMFNVAAGRCFCTSAIHACDTDHLSASLAISGTVLLARLS